MARTLHRLSPAFVTTTKTPGLHADGGNLYLRVGEDGSKRWAAIFQWRGRRREMGLGPLTSVSLKLARKAAADVRELVAADIDPIEQRRRARQTVPNFGTFADAYVETHKLGWKSEKHLSQWRYSIEVDAAKLRRLPVDQITVDHVLGVLKPIWLKKPETAKRCQGRIARILDAAKAAKLRQGENPAAWKGNLEALLPKQPKLVRGHHPAMAIEGLGGFMRTLRERPAMAARALEFTILTAARTGETLGARWAEIDMDKKIWTVPADRMKMGVQHRVPLSEGAVKVLERARQQAVILSGREPQSDDFVFSHRSPEGCLSDMAMAMLLRRMGVADVSVHGFRSTFRDWIGQETEFPRELAELSLAHLVGNDVERAYSRGDALDRRRKLMDAWSGFCGDEKAVATAAAA